MPHPDVEFALGDKHYDEWDEAAVFAIELARSTGRTVYIDVLIYSEEGAAAYGGDWAVDEYLEDPEASVFERWAIDLENLGRIP
jgi:hypothetical protein